MRRQILSDQQLIGQYIKGHEGSLEVLINRHKSKIFTHIVLIVRDRALAEDLFQDTFIKVIKTLRAGKYREEGKFLPWVMRIAHNLAVDYFRKSNRMPTTSGGDDFDIFDVISDTQASIEDVVVEDEIHSDLRALVEELPEKQKEVLIMRHYCDMSFKDIAEETNVSINTALGRMRYALINLRVLIEERDVTLTRD
ncbi:MAG TPA: sigma-70 family RNA polymerase sigma factor [Flavobacteriales bacterium]|nr:sigma-70 family RNA polymerase sigma factor [Flavobacteriales bacterium]HIO67864.1 sigma-70 family RNA polymerase sigma factor [Flavobacteriales bacterium]